MSRRIYNTEEIIAKLRQVEVMTSQGKSAIDAIRAIGVTDATYYWWRQEYGGQGQLWTTRFTRICCAGCRLSAQTTSRLSSQGSAGPPHRWNATEGMDITSV